MDTICLGFKNLHMTITLSLPFFTDFGMLSYQCTSFSLSVYLRDRITERAHPSSDSLPGSLKWLGLSLKPGARRSVHRPPTWVARTLPLELALLFVLVGRSHELELRIECRHSSVECKHLKLDANLCSSHRTFKNRIKQLLIMMLLLYP